MNILKGFSAILSIIMWFSSCENKADEAGGKAAVNFDSSVLSGDWLDENGFVMSFEYEEAFGGDEFFTSPCFKYYGSCLDFENLDYSEIYFNNDGSLNFIGKKLYKTDSDSGKTAAEKLKKSIEGDWYVFIFDYEHKNYSYMGIEVDFSDGKMSFIYDNTPLSVNPYSFDGCTLYMSEEMSFYARLEYEKLSLYDTSLGNVYTLMRTDNEEAKSLAQNGIDLTADFKGDFYEIIDGVLEKWSFDGLGTLLIDGEKQSYSANQTAFVSALYINKEKFDFYDLNESIEIYNKSSSHTLYRAESGYIKRFIKKQEITEKAAKLLKEFPDKDGWIDTKNCGDIPLLADADFIKKCLKQGFFTAGSPAELASYNYYINVIANDESFFLGLELTGDIDLSGYEWSPMGWTGEHPFMGLIQGQNFTISNLKIDGAGDTGFIGWEVMCVVKNLNIKNAEIIGGGHTGIMTGQAISGYYNNCSVSGTITGGSSGAFHGHSAHATIKDCTADVTIDGEKCEFMTYNDKQKATIKVPYEVTITIDENYTVTRPEIDYDYRNLGWTVIKNGIEVLDRNAENEYSFNYWHDSGEYEIYLTAFVEGQYIQISNSVKYTIR